LIDAGVPEAASRESADLLGVEVIGFDADLAHLAATLRPTTRKKGLSLWEIGVVSRWACYAAILW
jgi:PIN domain nuclease of toxin-antitoxin system